MSTSQDFEVHPIGTGRHLADLSDQVQELRDRLQSVIAWANFIIQNSECSELRN